MNREQIIKDWLEATNATIAALIDWRERLNEWKTEDVDYKVFLLEFQALCDVGLEGWLDGANGLSVDRLAEIITNGGVT